MAVAMIVLKDTEDGQVIQEVHYADGFDVKSNAHQYAGLMAKLAGDMVRGEQAAAPSAPPNLIVLG